MEDASSQGVFLHAETTPGASQLGAHHFVKGSGAAEKDFMEKKPQTTVLYQSPPLEKLGHLSVACGIPAPANSDPRAGRG